MGFGAGLGGIGAIIAGTAVVKMIPDFAGFAEKAKGELSRVAGSIGSVGSTLTKTLTLPILGFAALSVKAFEDVQKVSAQTDAVLKSTGQAAGITAAGVDKLARSLSEKTAIDHVSIQSTENLLLTFTAVRNEVGKGNDIFNQATSTVLDMSVALKEDAKSASIQLGKALQDPIRGITALRRVGVAFTDQQKAQIETLVKSGHTLEAQKMILAELRKEFGGSAEAFANTDAGKMKKAINELRDAGEKFGAIIAPALETVARWVGKLASYLDSFSPSARKWIVVVLGIVAAVGPLLVAVSKIIKAFQAISAAMKFLQLGSLLTNPITLIVIALVVAAVLIVKNWGPISRFFERLWKDITKIFDKAVSWISRTLKAWWPLLLIIFTGGLGLIIVAVVKNWTTIRNVFATAVHAIWAVVKFVVGAIVAFWRLEWNLIVAIVRLVWKVISNVVRTGVNIVYAIVSTIVKAIRLVWSVEWNIIVGVVRLVWAVIKAVIDAGAAIVRGIINGLIAVIRGIGDAFVWVKNTITGAVDWVIHEVKRLWNDISGPVKSIGHGIRKAFDKITPGSPIPLVVGVEASARALRKFSNEAMRLPFPNLDSAMNVSALRAGSRRGPSASGHAAAGAGDRHYHLSVSTKQSVGSIRRDFALMKVMGQ